ncbi:hypothetical protein LCGC14_1240730 [marine sediment metagenome]|uniref:Uncharacterized protein n=1 Tax=marine sediment metagenome TaxID=412755 RepID=A0A0F9L9X9_9ZZZZ
MKKDCTTCHFAEWPTEPSGRRRFHQGACSVAVLIPRAYRDMRGDMPQRSDISKYTCNEARCMCYKKEGKKSLDKAIRKLIT